jgi:hypothetical protein
MQRMLAATSAASSTNNTRVLAAVLLLCVLTCVNYLPWRAIDKYYHYSGMRPDIRSLAAEYDFGKSVVLIRGESWPDYQSAWTYNVPTLEADAPIYAWDRDADVRARLLQAYAGRPVWIVNGPSITNAGFSVVEGPISGDQLMAAERRMP